jgi:hypothetical protein
MMAEVENLLLDHLRHMRVRGQLDRMENDLGSISSTARHQSR